MKAGAMTQGKPGGRRSAELTSMRALRAVSDAVQARFGTSGVERRPGIGKIWCFDVHLRLDAYELGLIKRLLRKHIPEERRRRRNYRTKLRATLAGKRADG